MAANLRFPIADASDQRHLFVDRIRYLRKTMMEECYRNHISAEERLRYFFGDYSTYLVGKR